jgi:hypothetical protein
MLAINRYGWVPGSKLFCCLIALAFSLIALFSAMAVAAEELTDLQQAVHSSGLIVVGRVDGLADPDPAAQARRQREVHRITVIQTLKGHDFTGITLSIRPANVEWRDGQIYVFFIKPGMPIAGMVAPAAPALRMAATPENIGEVAAVVAGQGGERLPRLVFWTAQEDALGVRPGLILQVSGDFCWPRHNAESAADSCGKLSASQLLQLRSSLESIQAGAVPPADDAPLVILNWLDDNLVLNSRVMSEDHAEVVNILAPLGIMP